MSNPQSGAFFHRAFAIEAFNVDPPWDVAVPPTGNWNTLPPGSDLWTAITPATDTWARIKPFP